MPTQFICRECRILLIHKSQFTRNARRVRKSSSPALSRLHASTTTRSRSQIPSASDQPNLRLGPERDAFSSASADPDRHLHSMLHDLFRSETHESHQILGRYSKLLSKHHQPNDSVAPNDALNERFEEQGESLHSKFGIDTQNLPYQELVLSLPKVIKESGILPAWRLFNRHTAPASDPSRRIVQQGFITNSADCRIRPLQYFFISLFAKWANDKEPDLRRPPHPFLVIDTFYKAGLLHETHICSAISLCVRNILNQAVSPTPKGALVARPLAKLLVPLWSKIVFRHISLQEFDEKKVDWDEIWDRQLSDAVLSGPEGVALSKSLHILMPESQKWVIEVTPGLFMLTFYIIVKFRRWLRFTEQTLENTTPFLLFCARTLANSSVDVSFFDIRKRLSLSSLSAKAYTTVMGDKDQIQAFAALYLQNPGKEWAMKPSNPRIKYVPPTLEDSYLENLLQRLKKIERAQDIRVIMQVWEHAVKFYSSTERKRDDGTLDIPIAAYNAFIRILFGSHHARNAIEIWNFMLQNGTKPNSRTWNGMLQGAQRAKNLEPLEEMWRTMLASGVRPDKHLWTTRLFGLFHRRNGEGAWQALAEWDKQYEAMLNEEQGASSPEAATSGDKGRLEKFKPNVHTLNAILTALLRKGKQEWLGDILAWSKKYDIQPNTLTFNTLLHGAFQKGDHDEAQRYLGLMEKVGTTPDVATFNILLNATMRSQSFAQLSHEAQLEAIEKAFEDIRSRGVEINEFLFTTTIDAMLKLYDNFHAAGQLLKRMQDSNYRPPAALYTSLATHYFSRDPPDVTAADVLWQRSQGRTALLTDRIFQDRMIEGYAQCDEVGKMMTVLGEMSKMGRQPGWFALTMVVEALDRKGDGERAQQVVSDVRSREGMLSHGVRVRVGQRHMTRVERDFWDLAQRLGYHEPE